MSALIPIGPLRKSSRKPTRELDDGAKFDAATTHYEVLGISKRADAKALAYAWRRACSRWHPDREHGSHTRFQRCELAMAVLGDAARRKRYDETGEDDLPEPIEDKATRVLEQAFEDFLSREDADFDCTDWVKDGLRQALFKVTDELLDSTRKLNRAMKRSQKVRAKKSVTSLFAKVATQKIASLQQTLRTVKTKQRTLERALELIDEYEDVMEPVESSMEVDPAYRVNVMFRWAR